MNRGVLILVTLLNPVMTTSTAASRYDFRYNVGLYDGDGVSRRPEGRPRVPSSITSDLGDLCSSATTGRLVILSAELPASSMTTATVTITITTMTWRSATITSGMSTPTSSPFWTPWVYFDVHVNLSLFAPMRRLRCSSRTRWLQQRVRPQHDMSGAAPGNTTSIRRS